MIQVFVGGYDISSSVLFDTLRVDQILANEVDTATLQRLLREYGQLVGQPGIEQDPVGFANRSWLHAWENRWPRWPGWLDRRLHPRGPIRA